MKRVMNRSGDRDREKMVAVGSNSDGEMVLMEKDSRAKEREL